MLLSAGRARGVTLLELLVVMLIVLVVSAMTMTVTAPALQSRKIREAARTVEVIINKARNRALQTGRPAGIWIDRMPNLAEGAVSISLAEVPEAFTGDFTGSTVTIEMQGYGTTNPNTAPGYPEYIAVLKPAPDQWGTSDPTKQQAIRAGDQIQLGGIGPQYVINSSSTHQYGVDIANRNNTPIFYIARYLRAYDRYGNPVLDSNGFYRHAWYRNGGGYGVSFSFIDDGDTTVSPVIPAYSAPYSYRISRQPIKSAGGSVVLPSGTVIDLNYSGTKRLNFHPRLHKDYTDTTFNEQNLYGRPPNQYTGLDWFWTTAPTAAQPAQWPTDTSPVIIMFGSDGTVERMYTRTWEGTVRRDTNQTGSWEWRTTRVNEMIFLLVGKREKLPTPTLFDDHLNANWTDPENLWVTINASTGFIGTAQNAAVRGDLQVTGLRGHNNTYGNATVPPSESIYTDATVARIPFFSGLDHVGYGARRIAISQQIMGGK